MRCQAGDIAIIVTSVTGASVGKPVTCLEYMGKVKGFKGNDIWKVDAELQMAGVISKKLTIKANYIPDSWLMPIGKKQTQKAVEKEKPVEA